VPAAPATLDLDATRFDDACRALAEEVRQFEPDLVVGIATGGSVVARSVAPHLSGLPPVVDIELKRPSTRLKERVGAARLLGRLPRRAKNVLRWLEVEVREHALGRKRDARERAEAHAPDAGFVAALQGAARTLVIDDTVDTGRTLVTAVELARAAEPAAEVRTAVLASTFRNPPVRADYCLFDRTLLRLPWSLDV
jgi:hypoxanthine phosphoribosyltransferase